MKVEHILISLLFVFLLYHFMCKCRVEGLETPVETPKEWIDAKGEPWEAEGKWGCQGGGRVDWPRQVNQETTWPYCVYDVGGTVTVDDTSCRIVYRQDGNRYNEIVCSTDAHRRPLGKSSDSGYPPTVFDRINWGKCAGTGPGYFYTWESDGENKLKCKKCLRGGTQADAEDPWQCGSDDTNVAIDFGGADSLKHLQH